MLKRPYGTPCWPSGYTCRHVVRIDEGKVQFQLPTIVIHNNVISEGAPIGHGCYGPDVSIVPHGGGKRCLTGGDGVPQVVVYEDGPRTASV